MDGHVARMNKMGDVRIILDGLGVDEANRRSSVSVVPTCSMTKVRSSAGAQDFPSLCVQTDPGTIQGSHPVGTEEALFPGLSAIWC